MQGDAQKLTTGVHGLEEEEDDEHDGDDDVQGPHELPLEIVTAIQQLLQSQSGDSNAMTELLQQVCESEGVRVEVETDAQTNEVKEGKNVIFVCLCFAKV